MDLRELSYNRVGDIWTEPDHIYLVSQLDKIDRLAQQLHDKHTGAELKELRREA